MSNSTQPTIVSTSKRTPHWFFFGAYFALAVLWGVRSAYSRQPSVIDLLFPVAMAVTLAWWAIADSIALGRPIPVLSRVWFVLLSAVLVPGYFIWSRGWRGLGYVLVLAVAWYGVCLVAMIAGRVVAIAAGAGR